MMIKRLCEQQAAVAALLLPKQDLSHLELSSNEWRLLEDIAVVLEPFKDATVFLSGDTYPTISVLGPLFNQIKLATTVNDSDSAALKDFKRALANNMNSRYQDKNVLAVHNKASFLDPRFKTLAHLPSYKQDTVDSILDLVESCSRPLGSRPSLITSTNCCDIEGSPAKRPKGNILEKMLGDKFDSSHNHTMEEATTVSYSELMNAEISQYKSESSLNLREDPLKWWRLLPLLSTLS